MKNAGVSATNKILADATAGASEPAQNSSGSTYNAKDKNDTKTHGSVAATKFMKTENTMKEFTIVPNSLMHSYANYLRQNTFTDLYKDIPQQRALDSINISLGRNTGSAVSSPASGYKLTELMR
jgi:hypothetical protein